MSRSNAVSIDTQLKQIADDLTYYHKKIIDACKAGTGKELEVVIEKVIKLFAKRTAVKLATEKELYGNISEDMRHEAVSRYGAQCTRFLDTVEELKNAYA